MEEQINPVRLSVEPLDSLEEDASGFALDVRLGRLSDPALWGAFKKGNQEAYTLIYNRYFPVLYNYGRHLFNHDTLVEDCIQELFLDLLKSRENLADVVAIKYYLFRALRRRIHKATQLQDRQLGQDQLPTNYDFEIVVSPEQVLIFDQGEEQRHDRLRQALNGLPRRQREAMFLIFYQDLTHKEAASVMSVEVKTVYNLVYNSLVLLKSLLGNRMLLLFLLGSLLADS